MQKSSPIINASSTHLNTGSHDACIVIVMVYSDVILVVLGFWTNKRTKGSGKLIDTVAYVSIFSGNFFHFVKTKKNMPFK